MINIDEMIKKEFEKLKESSTENDKKLNYKARVNVYKYLRYKLDDKTKVMSYDQYSDYMRLESSILFSDLTYKSRRSLRNGYDHLYNEFQDLFRTLNRDEIQVICSKCLSFSKDISKFEDLKDYLKYIPIKTYVRFIASRYKPVLANYKKDELGEYCDKILSISKKENKSRV